MHDGRAVILTRFATRSLDGDAASGLRHFGRRER
jgi:hypothetical protein